jgi:hypothetical protein
MPGAIGYGSVAVNSQLVPIPVKAAYNPIAFGGAYTGPSWPRNGIWNVPPIMPMGASGGSGTGLAPSTPGGRGPTATSATGNPYSLKSSPVLWALAFLILALVLLHKVHW